MISCASWLSATTDETRAVVGRGASWQGFIASARLRRPRMSRASTHERPFTRKTVKRQLQDRMISHFNM